ncbi:hypothetical protein F4803DRAFT_520265 [Xylaria telfairii]|nr:hypothetical protein F4803DRAFT_520265 [Xylaria telfairii]
MQFQLGLSLLVAALAAAGPFTMRFHASQRCDGRSLGCNRYDAYECCEEPPSPSSFPAVRATSGGEFGLVIFTEVTAGGGCGLCKSVGQLSTCYLNSPFNTLFVATITQCHASASMQRGVDSVSRIPVIERHSECNRTVPIDTATVNGREYDLTGAERLDVMADVMDMDNDAAFHSKWAHLYRRQVTSGSPTTLSTSTATNRATIVPA